MEKNAYLLQPSGPSFPSVGSASPEITFEKRHAYRVVSSAGAELELGKMVAIHWDYDWEVCRIEESENEVYIVVGHPRAD
jgi:hypothetical protein